MCPEKADIVDALSGYKHDISTIKMHNSLKMGDESKESWWYEDSQWEVRKGLWSYRNAQCFSHGRCVPERAGGVKALNGYKYGI
jgi:hypothetical protein